MSESNGTRSCRRLVVGALLIGLTALFFLILSIETRVGLDELEMRLRKTEDKCIDLRNSIERNRYDTVTLLRLIQESTDFHQLKRKTRDWFPNLTEKSGGE